MAIHLRPIEESDLPQLKSWRNDPRLRHTFRSSRLLNMINQKDWLERVSRDVSTGMFGIAEKGTLIGACGLCNINWVNLTAEVSIYVEPILQDKALLAMKELHQKAFEEYNLHRLWAEVYEFDTFKVALFEEAGYTLEGTLRQHVFKLGRYHDSLMYGLLR